ncbi:hypothetical protein [Bradyrhizobium sp. ERR14]|uniref:hypothetical protein n=1 Tax=Bradyrhizobium sp. ERR14 TaxID=2663837 RepID=UPI0018223EB5|nr:hypothetical protein [Bradyrhizobium sp. ERR14]MBB4394589.1 hypothetical protein [Bradyrhizobium sp. ERR14]
MRHRLLVLRAVSISREIIPYSVDALSDAAAERSGVITERAPGLELYLDPAVVKSGDAARAAGKRTGFAQALVRAAVLRELLWGMLSYLPLRGRVSVRFPQRERKEAHQKVYVGLTSPPPP